MMLLRLKYRIRRWLGSTSDFDALVRRINKLEGDRARTAERLSRLERENESVFNLLNAPIVDVTNDAFRAWIKKRLKENKELKD